KEQSISIAAALESHANHPIARAFKVYTDQNVAVSDVENIIGSGIQGDYQGKQTKIGSAPFVLGEANSGEPNSIYLALDDVHIATFKYQDPIRKEANSFIERFQKEGIKVTLLTGDSQ
ncbi:ATPase P, partial [Vibrio xuii]